MPASVEAVFCDVVAEWIVRCRLDELVAPDGTSLRHRIEQPRVLASESTRRLLSRMLPASAPNAHVFRFYADVLRSPSQHVRVKLLVLGDGGEGKTMLLHSLVHGATPSVLPDFTDGIALTDWHVSGDLTVHCYDFAGQAVYQLTHPLFYSRNSVVLMVYNLRHGIVGQLDKWLASVRQHLGPGSGVRLVFVATQCDGLPLEVPDHLARTLEDARALAGSGGAVLGPVFVDSGSTQFGISELRNALTREFAHMFAGDRRAPSQFVAMADGLTEQRQHGEQVLSLDWAHNVLLRRGGSGDSVVDRDAVERAVRYAHDAGACLWFEGVERARPMVFVRPQLVADAVAGLVTARRARGGGAVVDESGCLTRNEAVALVSARAKCDEHVADALLYVLHRLGVVHELGTGDVARGVLVPGAVRRRATAAQLAWLSVASDDAGGDSDAGGSAVELVRELCIRDVVAPSFIHALVIAVLRTAAKRDWYVRSVWSGGCEVARSDLSLRAAVHVDADARAVRLKAEGHDDALARAGMAALRDAFYTLRARLVGMAVDEYLLVGSQRVALRDVEAISRGADLLCLGPVTERRAQVLLRLDAVSTARLTGVRTLIDSGAFGDVYVVRDAERTFALKTVRLTRRLTLEMARREFEKAKLVTHARGLLRVMDAWHDEEASTFNVCMEWCQGGSLRQLLNAARSMATVERAAIAAPARLLTGADVVPFLRAVCDLVSGLCALEEHGLVHLDVKPENVFLRVQGGEFVIGDFGSAQSEGTLRAGDVGVDGTPLYMSPEQASRYVSVTRAAGDPRVHVNHVSDVYSLGLVLFEIVCWNLPEELELLRSSGPLVIMQAIAGNDVAHHVNGDKVIARVQVLLVPLLGEPASTEFGAIVASMLSRDASLRPPASLVRDRLQAAGLWR